MNKNLISIAVVVVLLIGIGVFAYSKNPHPFQKDTSLVDFANKLEQDPLVKTEPLKKSDFWIPKNLPQNLKIISKTKTQVILQGEFLGRDEKPGQGILYKVAIGTSLRPDGKCEPAQDGYYYNTKTKIGYLGWQNAPLDEKKSGDMLTYNCIASHAVSGYRIPEISNEVPEKYDSGDYRYYAAGQAVAIAMGTIQNSYLNEIYTLTNPAYTLEELDKHGKELQTIFSRRCMMPQYNSKPLLKTGPNSGGCSPVYWQSASQNVQIMDPDSIDQSVRNNFLALLTTKGCTKDYVANYLATLSADTSKFSKDTFVKDLSCAGTISFGKVFSGME